jgi:starch phosphorylase
LQRAADGGKFGLQMTAWTQSLREKWPLVRFGEITIETVKDQHQFAVQVDLAGLDPNSVRVELYANSGHNGPAERQELKRLVPEEGKAGYAYVGCVPAIRPPMDYTARVVPSAQGVSIPLEAENILWQH